MPALCRRLKFFKWQRHAAGKLRCIQGIVADVKSHGGVSEGEQLDLAPDVVTSLFRDAQEGRDAEEVVKLASTLTQAGIKLDRHQQVRHTALQPSCHSSADPCITSGACTPRFMHPVLRTRWHRIAHTSRQSACSQVGVIFAHFSLRQTVQGFGMLMDLYQSGHTVNDRVYDTIAEELSKHVRFCACTPCTLVAR